MVLAFAPVPCWLQVQPILLRTRDPLDDYAGVLSEAGKSMNQDDPCDSLPPDTSCYHDAKVWRPVVASVSQCLLKRPLVYIGDNTRLQCDQMRRLDPSVVQVDQSHCYPDEYFTALPSASYLLERYPVNLRPKSTDLDVLQQVCLLPSLVSASYMHYYVLQVQRF